MKVDIWMPLYIGDYLRDTQDLTLEEHAVYLLLMMHYWMREGDIGNDVSRIARACRADEETCRFILGYFFKTDGLSYSHKRIDEELEKAHKRREAAIENGKKGGRPPINNPRETYRLAIGNPEGNPGGNPRETSSSSSPSSSSKPPKNARARAVVPDQEEDIPFDDIIPARKLASEWYKHYHKKTARLIEPSEKDYQAAADLLKRTDITTAISLIDPYFTDELWFTTAKGTGKTVYSFQGFCRHFTELSSTGPPGKSVKRRCQKCNALYLDMDRCPRCGEELVDEV